MFAPTKEQVAHELEELREAEEWKFAELPVVSFEMLTDNAVLVRFPVDSFTTVVDKKLFDKVWFPLRMMRELSGGFYFFKPLAVDKGLNVDD